jgi:hypothetical protein
VARDRVRGDVRVLVGAGAVVVAVRIRDVEDELAGHEVEHDGALRVRGRRSG